MRFRSPAFLKKPRFFVARFLGWHVVPSGGRTVDAFDRAVETLAIHADPIGLTGIASLGRNPLRRSNFGQFLRSADSQRFSGAAFACDSRSMRAVL